MSIFLPQSTALALALQVGKEIQLVYNLPPRFLAGPVLQAGRYFYEVRIVEILDPFDAQGQSCLQVELAVVAKK